MTDRNDQAHAGLSAVEGAVEAPATWPRDTANRVPPGSRLNQAVSVARQHAMGEAHLPLQMADSETVHGSKGGEDARDPSGPQDDMPFQAPSRTGSELSRGAREATMEDDEASGDSFWQEPQRSESGSEWGRARGAPSFEDEGSPRELVVDLTDVDPTDVDPTEGRPHRRPVTKALRRDDYGLGSRWGRSWTDSAQGWVRDEKGRQVWRPVVSTTESLSAWDVDTYLGVVTAEVAVDADGSDLQHLGASLARGRAVGLDGLVSEAVERGAHGIIGVAMQYAVIAERILVTLSGTAVTLREKR